MTQGENCLIVFINADSLHEKIEKFHYRGPKFNSK